MLGGCVVVPTHHHYCIEIIFQQDETVKEDDKLFAEVQAAPQVTKFILSLAGGFFRHPLLGLCIKGAVFG